MVRNWNRLPREESPPLKVPRGVSGLDLALGDGLVDYSGSAGWILGLDDHLKGLFQP